MKSNYNNLTAAASVGVLEARIEVVIMQNQNMGQFDNLLCDLLV